LDHEKNIKLAGTYPLFACQARESMDRSEEICDCEVFFLCSTLCSCQISGSATSSRRTRCFARGAGVHLTPPRSCSKERTTTGPRRIFGLDGTLRLVLRTKIRRVHM
jgi:hypothetical protein